MNERIRELYYECQDESQSTEQCYQKFAELIVKECIDIAQDRAAFDWAPPNDVNDIINDIREHFGVEETHIKGETK
jgi:hypothetical protein